MNVNEFVEVTPAIIVRELVATEIHRRRLLRVLEQITGKKVLDPAVFGYSHLMAGGDGGTHVDGFGEGFNLTDEAVEILLNAAIDG